MGNPPKQPEFLKPLCSEHERLCDDLSAIKVDTAETKKSVEKIIKNHLWHLDMKVNFLLFLVPLAFTIIAIIVMFK